MPETVEALLVVLLAIVPGYLARGAWSRNKTFKAPSTDLTVVIQSIAASVVIQVLMAPLTIPLILYVDGHWTSHLWPITCWLVATGIVALVAGYAFGRISDTFPRWWPRWLGRALTSDLPTLWDAAHLRDLIPDPSLLVIEFTDGKRLGGAFASGSYATTSPHEHGIFLIEECLVDPTGIPGDPIPQSAGVLVPTVADIRSVHVFTQAPTQATIDT